MSDASIVDEYITLQEQTDAELLAMQCGDFYEFFGENADTTAQILDLDTSEKSTHGSTYTMAGVPVTDFEPYVQTLVEHGYRVAIANQYEVTDGEFEREIDRVATPGTLLETTDAAAQYFCTVTRDEEDALGVGFVDVTTGKFFVDSMTDGDVVNRALTEIYRFNPVEVLPGPRVRDDESIMERIQSQTDATVTLPDKDLFAPGKAKYTVIDHFGDGALESVGVTQTAAVTAAGAALAYIDETGVGVLESLTRLQTIGSRDHVSIDATTQRNLELTKTMQGGTDDTVVDTINHTATSAGYRLLREWVTQPTQDVDELHRRQACVSGFVSAVLPREQLQDILDGAYDLERLAGRAASGYLSPRELQAAINTLQLVPDIHELVAATPQLKNTPLMETVEKINDTAVLELANELDEALVDDPPRKVSEGGVIATGFDAELDELITEHEDALEWIESLADREQEKHGITHLSVGRTQTDGYYIQVGKSETDAVPDMYDRIKTLKNSKRYTIPELKEKERDVLRLEEKRYVLEERLFNKLQSRVAENAALLQRVGEVLAEVDVFASLATHAVRNNWVAPDVVQGGEMKITQGRHPVVEQTTNFVPNDVSFHDDREFLIVTGPNMSGKSTYMRQVALITLLAQIGSYVPAEDAVIPVVDGIYTRVGALDELAQGRSTFLVEMQELSNILHSATEDSLVILDEVGRGTATYDGISIAWAATEYLHNTVRSNTLFATHYHELTGLASELKRVENVHVAADESNDDVTFLHMVRDGPTDKSYGVHVADMAGVPDPVVSRAHGVLDKLRNEKQIETRAGGNDGNDGTTQVVFDTDTGMTVKQDAGTTSGENSQNTQRDGAGVSDALEDVRDELESLNVNEVPPIELVTKVQQWQEELEQSNT